MVNKKNKKTKVLADTSVVEKDLVSMRNDTSAVEKDLVSISAETSLKSSFKELFSDKKNTTHTK